MIDKVLSCQLSKRRRVIILANLALFFAYIAMSRECFIKLLVMIGSNKRLFLFFELVKA